MTDQETKLLFEPFWTDRWMGSSAFLLPLEPRGLYREMLTQAWRRGGRLPNDHEAIRRACGVTEAEWARAWPLVERYWRVESDSLVNDTQREVFEDAVNRHRKKSEQTRRAAQLRWRPGEANGYANADANAQARAKR